MTSIGASSDVRLMSPGVPGGGGGGGVYMHWTVNPSVYHIYELHRTMRNNFIFTIHAENTILNSQLCSFTHGGCNAVNRISTLINLKKSLAGGLSVNN